MKEKEKKHSTKADAPKETKAVSKSTKPVVKETKTAVRESKPLAETPTYNADASTLADKLKKIQSDSDARRQTSAAERKLRMDLRREKMATEGSGSGSGSKIRGLNTALGEKIITT